MKASLLYLPILVLQLSCHSGSGTAEEETPETTEVQTPVSVISVSTGTLTEYVDLNATATYLQFNTIKAQTNGYLKTVGIQQGQLVRAGQTAFVMKTKEAQALGNTINALDSSFRFTGIITIHAAVSGYVQELNHQAGDYVQDGEQLAVLTDLKSFSFILFLPFELRPHVQLRQRITIALPDGTDVAGTVASILPTIDSVSQSEQVVIHVNTNQYIPQNVIGKVSIPKALREQAMILPKEAILSDESQTEFWVMKMIDSVTAVRITIIRGMEANGKVEIVAPKFLSTDQIIVSGNYGLADTAKVKVIKVE